MRKTHDTYLIAADKYQDRYSNKKRYKLQTFFKADGVTPDDSRAPVPVPIKGTLPQRYLKWQIKTGKKIQTGANKVRGGVLQLIRVPRTSGSNYASDKAKDELLIGNKTKMANYPNSAINSAEAVNGVNSAVGVPQSAVGDPLSMMSLGVNWVDLGLVSDPFLKMLDALQRSKDTLASRVQDFEAFLKDPATATPEQAEGFLEFRKAAEYLVSPSLAEKAARKTHKDRVTRIATLLASSHVAAAFQIGDTVVKPLAHVGALFTGVFGAISSLIDIRESVNELKRRFDEIALANDRKMRMNSLVTMKGGLSHYLTEGGERRELKSLPNKEEQLLLALINGLQKSQDRIIKAASREKKIAGIQAGKATAGVPLNILTTVASGLAIGGLAAGPVTLGASAAVTVAVGAGWSVLLAYRDLERSGDETEGKALQRSADMLGYAFTREQLEDMVIHNSPVVVGYGQGDYVGDGKFAGERVVAFMAQENPYLVCQVAARWLQDLIHGRRVYEAKDPLMQLLHRVLKFDLLAVLAIGKVASVEKGPAQVEYMESQLLDAAGWKFRLASDGSQAPPHPSFFIDLFNEAVASVDPGLLSHSFKEYGAGHESDHEQILQKLQGLLQGEGGLDAFVSGISAFLKKTDSTANSPVGDYERLKSFVKWMRGDWKSALPRRDQGRAGDPSDRREPPPLARNEAEPEGLVGEPTLLSPEAQLQAWREHVGYKIEIGQRGAAASGPGDAVDDDVLDESTLLFSDRGPDPRRWRIDRQVGLRRPADSTPSGVESKVEISESIVSSASGEHDDSLRT